jgi:GalNAc-alpha-(1->4)-GalNAc-alpha-(1->3)-diNAcBac-PP-undecaprenol alpha-1,4-N-acetyl-D-galactosaminyltransferase
MNKPSVCFVIHSLQAGGMERVMSELVNYFAATEKYTVHLVLYGLKREVFYEVSQKVHIHKPSFEFDNSKRLFHTVKTIAFLRKTIRAINPISVLSFGERWNSLVLVALWGTKIPVFVSDRAQPDKPLGFKDDLLRKLLYPTAEGVIVQTEKAFKIHQTKYHHENLSVIGNPIRAITINNAVKENYILMVGRFIASKQQNKLIEIFARINAPDWKLVLVGYDHLKQANQAKWEQLAADLKIAERVIFTGKQSNVEHYYSNSKIFAFTSASEGFPNVIGEAMSAGLPIVAYDCVAGPSDLITNGEDGFLIPLNEEDIFAEKLHYLVTNEADRKRMGEAAQRNITRFNSHTICKKFEEFITTRKKSFAK